MELFHAYQDVLKSQNRLSEFWMSYIDITEILLGVLRALREGDWILNLASIRNMIPWCFSYDKLNYACFSSYYYAAMSQLPKTRPCVYDYFLEGGFAVQLGSKNPFGRIPVDQTIKETVNKDTQTPGGTKRSECRISYLQPVRGIAGQNNNKMSHSDLQLARIKRYEACSGTVGSYGEQLG